MTKIKPGECLTRNDVYEQMSSEHLIEFMWLRTPKLSSENHHTRYNIMDIEKQVAEWHKTTFPRASMDAIFNKFSEEMMEFEDEILVSMPNIFEGKTAEEFVDMIIVFMAARAKLNHPPLSELIAQKLEINKNRVWGNEISNGDRPRVK